MSSPFPGPPGLPVPAPPPVDAIFLVDNGSLEPAATHSLREVAKRLEAVFGRSVLPVSLLHSSAIDPVQLDGQPAEIAEPAMRHFAAGGGRSLLLLPFFLGPSGALTDYLPERVRKLHETWPDLQVRVAASLMDASLPNDTRLAAILAGRVLEAAKAAGFLDYAVAVVDHGTPQQAVNAVRELIAAQVKQLLGDAARAVRACSMERRAGAEYDFNEPLLERLLDAPEFAHSAVVVAKLFLQPGRHAGPGGDVEQIARAAQARHPALKIAFTEPLASHPGIGEILAERAAQGLRTEPLR